MKTKILAIVLAVLMFLFALTFSIALPIYVRPFYYAHIDVMRLDEISGKSKTQIIDAYNELLDYLTGNTPYGVGVFKSSPDGQSHFEDCKVLFMLDKWLLIAVSVLLVGILAYIKLTKQKPLRLKGYPPYFWAGVIMIVIILTVVGLASIDFDYAFTVFHTIFFPGKTNWVFNPYTDEIIMVMPQEFFRNCGILIAVGIVVFCSLFIAFGIRVKNKEKQITQNKE